MKMAAAAGNGDEQVRIEGPNAHGPAVGTDSFSCESLIFPPSPLRMQPSTEPPGPEGGNAGRRPRLAAMIYRKDYYGRNCNPHFRFRRGYFVEVRACAIGFLQVFSPPGALKRRSEIGVSPPGATCAEGGVVVPHRARCLRRRGSGRTPRRRQVELPRLARPKGCFDTSAEWS